MKEAKNLDFFFNFGGPASPAGKFFF